MPDGVIRCHGDGFETDSRQLESFEHIGASRCFEELCTADGLIGGISCIRSIYLSVQLYDIVKID